MRRLGTVVVLLVPLALAATADARPRAVFCGQERVERRRTSSESEEARYGRIFITITTGAMSAIYRESPRNWTSRREATCELADLVAGEAVSYQLDDINTFSPGFVGMGAKWYVGRYHCISEAAPEPPGFDRGEVETCSHRGHYANSVRFWSLETGETL